MSFNDYWQAEHRRREVEAAMRQLPTQSPAAQQHFTQVLRDAVLLFPIESLAEGVQRGDLFASETSPTVNIKVIRGNDGKLFFPLFTSEAELVASFGEEQPFLLVPFPQYAQMALRANAAVIVNPKSELRALLPPDGLRALTQPPPNPQQAANPMRLVPPTRLLSYRELTTLQGWLSQQDELRQAYLFGLVQGGQPALTLGVDFATPKDKATMEALARDLHGAFGPLLLIPLDARTMTAVSHLPTAIHFDLRP
ncbi:MAG: SseB family protein [Anaerolineales bacterium]|nr:SseB family protein [Anaerolineales bacterium]MCB9127757.1 SseB family protein [Ardenticatenales bacterium]